MKANWLLRASRLTTMKSWPWAKEKPHCIEQDLQEVSFNNALLFLKVFL